MEKGRLLAFLEPFFVSSCFTGCVFARVRDEFVKGQICAGGRGGGGANFYSSVCVCVNEYESRAQPLQNMHSGTETQRYHNLGVACSRRFPLAKSRSRRSRSRSCSRDLHVSGGTGPRPLGRPQGPVLGAGSDENSSIGDYQNV